MSEPGDPSRPATAPGRVQLAARSGALVLVGCAIAAMLIQDVAGVLPMSLHNQRREAWELVSWLALAAVALAGFVLLAEWRGTAVGRLAGLLRGLLFSFVLLELSLAALDAILVSRGPHAAVGGPYQEVRSADGEWVSLKKAHRASAMGFRTAKTWSKDGEELRVLFLGDSYTEGSGRAADCNYPEVAGARLAEILGRPVQVLNAGVPGHGPDDSLRVLRYLISEGYRFDAIVHQVFLENDFTDNLPATERRVVAGMLFRFPESFFLRTFNPMNGRTAHWILFVSGIMGDRFRITAEDGGGTDGERAPGRTCVLDEQAGADPKPGVRRYMKERFEINYGTAPRIAAGEVARGLEAISGEAHELGVPLVRVVFPDRILVDASIRAQLGVRIDRPGVDPERLIRLLRATPGLLIDASVALRAGTENYREDTHLSDLGNLRAGEFVGDQLAQLLPTAAPRFRSGPVGDPSRESP